MRIERWNQSVEKLLKQRNGFLVISLGLMIANIMLGLMLFGKNERVIIVPAYMKQNVWSEGSLVSESYIEEMALFFSKLMLDTTPDSHGYRKDVILRYVAAEHYHDVEKRLISDAERMKKEGVTTVFAPKEIIVDVKGLKAEIVGVLTKYIAGSRMGQSKEIYEIEFGYSGGIFMLKNFKSK
ncbi:type IV conjugative transfer system protein TraE [Candidatus Bandiella numerosa]|uniref:type IV conjugative transfer system protein TraE n=1 Tax=Candidatus Bandiella numerosa TaxID=2570586 RepID=UPI001F0022A3|nr:type IV conjugative transfer system protein TraE [Candidatus Bandiella numerosa]